MHHAILVHEDGGKPSAQIFANRQEARDAFHKITTGTAALYELTRSQAVKRANYDIVHKTNKNALADMTEDQLRSEARKHNLSGADNPQADRTVLLGEIQQDELTKRLAHRRPLSSTPEAPLARPRAKTPVK
ncbi:MAG: hypothetical protein H0X34_19025 [Chthoniobacterales bacterium]|nr:hypothetical protein [Chthoniobacterales bacterium]